MAKNLNPQLWELRNVYGWWVMWVDLFGSVDMGRQLWESLTCAHIPYRPARGGR